MEGGAADERSVEDLLSFIDGPAADSGKHLHIRGEDREEVEVFHWA